MCKWLLDYWRAWVFLLSGPASILLMYLGTPPGTPLPAVLWWMAGYFCVGVGAMIVIHGMYIRLRELEARGLTVEQRQLAQARLRQLTDGEREALRALLVEQRLTGDQVRERFPDGREVDFTRINKRTAFLTLEHVLRDIGTITDSWSIRPEWQGILASLLVAPERWSWLAKGKLVLLRMQRGFTREGRRHLVAVRQNRRTRH